MALMALGVKQSESIYVTMDGNSKKANVAKPEQFFKDNQQTPLKGHLPYGGRP